MPQALLIRPKPGR